jgi:hypothetical protein
MIDASVATWEMFPLASLIATTFFALSLIFFTVAGRMLHPVLEGTL